MTEAEFEAIQDHSRDPYGPGFFKFTEMDHGWSNQLFGDVLHHIFQPKSVIELGCGTGATLAALRRQGVEVQGVDGFESCIPFIARHDPIVAEQVIIHDLTHPFTPPKKYDLAISIECLEHIAPEGADSVVASICRSADRCVVTASPGRPNSPNPNPLHLNEQPFTYWVEKFAAQGFVQDRPGTTAVHRVMRAFQDIEWCPVVPAWYFADYLGVFVKEQG